MVAGKDRQPAELPKASISAAGYGLSRAALTVHTAEDAKQFAITSASLTLGAVVKDRDDLDLVRENLAEIVSGA